MGKLFGTDGIRGRANTYPMTPETALKTGRALAKFFGNKGASKIIIGKDTRISGDMLEHALASGICSMGMDACLVGVIPTPGVAYLARSISDAAAGVVISASHNPYEDNGIKVFNGEGFKLDDDKELILEQWILDDGQESMAESVEKPGRVTAMEDGVSMYCAFLEKQFSDHNFSGIKAVIDCSNGASSSIAPGLLTALGVKVNALSVSPDGTNINRDCGSEHIEKLIEQVIETRADIGLAFDGDADRLIAVDHEGRAVTGDQIIAVCALYAKDTGFLSNNTVVTTVMSNMGLGACLEDHGITHVMSKVGDRHVMMDMVKTGASVGGENSGHMIFMNHHTTGDGLISALMLLSVVNETGKPLKDLARVMAVYPQKIENVVVKSKPDIESVPEIVAAIHASEKDLEGTGRVLVRYSGTQPMCRVMVESSSLEATETHVRRISEVIKRTLGV